MQALTVLNAVVLLEELGSLISAGQGNGGFFGLVWHGRCKVATCKCGKNLVGGY